MTFFYSVGAIFGSIGNYEKLKYQLEKADEKFEIRLYENILVA